MPRTSSARLGGRLLLGGVAGEREEHVVERRAAERDVVDRRRRRRRAGARPRRSRPCALRTGTRTTPSSSVGRLVGHLGQRGDRRARRRPRPRGAPRAARRRRWSLSSSEVPSAITLPWSITTIRSARRSASSRYCVVSSTVVPAGDARLDRLPHAEAAARVEARSSARRGTAPAGGARARPRGRAAGACRRSRSSPGAWRRRRGRSARAARSRALRASLARQVVEPADHLEVLEAGQVLVDRRVLAGEADLARAARRRRARRRARRRGRCPRRAASSVVRMRTAVVLPAPLGPSRPSTVPVGAVKSTPHSACTEP